MKKSLLLLVLIPLSIYGCKKDSTTSNKLQIKVTGVTSGVYSINISNQHNIKTVFNVTNKTENTTYEADVTEGDELTCNVKFTIGGTVSYLYNRHSVGGGSFGVNGSSKTTIVIK